MARIFPASDYKEEKALKPRMEVASMRQFLEIIGYRNADDAIDFLMAGIAILPGLLMLSGYVAAGAMVFFILIVLLASIGLNIPPPPPNDEATKKDANGKKPSH